MLFLGMAMAEFLADSVTAFVVSLMLWQSLLLVKLQAFTVSDSGRFCDGVYF